MVTPQYTVLDESLARTFVPQRDADAHKWGVGGVIIVAGSPAYPGAAILASRAAGRAGAGIVQLATTRGVVGMVAAAIPEVAFIPLGETESSSGARRAVEAITEQGARATAMVIGPGLGTDESSSGLLAALLGIGDRADASRSRMGFGSDSAPAKPTASNATRGVFENADLHIVIDADGLNWLAQQGEWWTRVPVKRMVLTPHPGEMSRLLGIDVAEVLADPIAIAVQAASTWQQTVFLKGERAVVSDGESTYVSDIATPSLATAGSGDVLAGTVGGLLAQLGSTFPAAALAAYLGPRAALRLEERFGVLGLISTDLPDGVAHELTLLAT